MARNCPKCGKELPEGASVCPDCGAAAEEARGAALFTQMTAETEGWRSREKRERTPEQKRRTWIILAAVFVVAVGVFLFLFLRPEARVLRALEAGHYTEASTIYWSDGGLARNGSEAVDRAVLEAAEKINRRFADRELDGDTAARDISTLSTIGRGGEQLSDVIEGFLALNESRGHMDEARRLSRAGEYLAAREEFLLVSEVDGDYGEAQGKARECLFDYGDSVLRQADLSIQTGDYAEAIRTVAAGEAKLLEYDFYYEKLDLKHKALNTLLGEDLLRRAAELAAGEDYQGAAELLRAHIDEFSLTDEGLETAYADNFARARSKDVSDAAARAAEKFDAGDYAGAFAELDALSEQEDLPADELEAALEALERRFAEVKLAEAGEVYGNDRDNLPDAIAVLREALRIREVDDIADYWEELRHYLPFSLVDEDYIEKVGVIFRTSSAFEALDGTSYRDGWIWGENESEVSFDLAGEYDLLEAVFTVRRDDEEEAAAAFELYCDGALVYTSEKLEHSETEPVAIRVSVAGCQKLTVRFLNDYSVSTTDDGYCYHGLCNPVVTKNIA